MELTEEQFYSISGHLPRQHGNPEQIYMLMDKAYEGDEMRAKVAEEDFIPVAPPVKSRGNTIRSDTSGITR
jgi:hypothetical protein